jgi:predicted ATPase
VISHLELANFKCFSALRLGLGRLTLLTGFNAGGKSSAVQPLLLLAQAFRGGASNLVPLNGELVRLGTTGDVVPAVSSDAPMSFAVAADNEEIRWELTAKAGERNLRMNPPVGSLASAAQLSRVHEYLKKVLYISAIRVGPQEFYPVPELDTELRDIGVDGRYAAYWCGKLADDEVDERRRCPAEQASTLRKQVDAWMSTLFPEAKVNVQHLPQASGDVLQFRVSEIGEWRRPANVGYGFTYAFPIVVALLVATADQVVVVDSPEAHLHPSAQSAMGRLLARFASAGVQIIVETHSDHLLNGARLAVMEEAMRAEDLQIHFFTGASDEGHGVISPLVDAKGRLSTWPEGFFDQGEKDLAQLSGWA